MLQERARQLEIFGFKSLREAVIDESEFTSSLITLAAFGEQTGQGHRRSQLQGQRRLDARGFDGFVQAIHDRCPAVLRRGRKDLRFDPQPAARAIAPLTVRRASSTCPVMRRPSAKAPAKGVSWLFSFLADRVSTALRSKSTPDTTSSRAMARTPRNPRPAAR